MAEGLAGKIALVTGGAAGIGRTIAMTFANAGARVIIADTDERGAEEAVGLITAAGGAAHAVATDVTRTAAVQALLAHIAATWGRLDCACNNAGMADGAPAWLDVTEDAWERVLTLNLTGVWLCMRAEIRQMLSQGRGTIVNIASIFGLVGSPTSPALTASKHGVVGLTKSAAVAYGQAGIRINAVCPAFIESPVLDRLFRQYPDQRDRVVARHPVARLGTAEEVAETVVWLCSDAAAFITGQALAVDGGYVAQ
jgi:NAD(P)-dependent dehydrogenase (short-subunit alcohol dehydrogenase family)